MCLKGFLVLQLLYVSSVTPGSAIDLDTLLSVSQTRNLQDGITGLLYTDGRRFLQVLEGPNEPVEDTFLRITKDPRHRALVRLSRRLITRREFGEWSMARREVGGGEQEFLDRIADLCCDADPSVAGTFAGLVTARRAA